MSFNLYKTKSYFSFVRDGFAIQYQEVGLVSLDERPKVALEVQMLSHA